MPIFNCSDTLPFALASLQAQTCEDWECIVVDDGSTDDPGHAIGKIDDLRIQYHPLDHNYGRGYARQHALETARGHYVAFLDGDDWIFPTKLQDQLELFRTEPNLAIVSTSMAISNMSGRLTGVRSRSVSESFSRGWYNKIGMPPVSFPASMLPSALAKETGFDSSYPTAEDTDFLLRAMLGRQYAVLSRPLYVYREQGAMTLNKVSSALNCCCRMFAKQFEQHPMESVIEITKARSKQIIYHAASAVGVWEYIIARRSRVPNSADYEQYQDAWRTVYRIAAGYALEF
jgi:glycosyltransferase involved in cell wall biosynthesis